MEVPESGQTMATASEDGSLMSEEWWRDRYHVLEKRGYRLRPKYHPDWVPSWKKSGKGTWTGEDGRLSLVSIVHLISSMHHNLALVDMHSDGRHARGRNAGGAQEGSFDKWTAGIEYRPNVLLARSQGRARNHCVPLLEILGIFDPRSHHRVFKLQASSNPQDPP